MASSDPQVKNKFGIAVHGGAGVIKRGSLNSEQERDIRKVLADAVQAGLQALAAPSVPCSCNPSDDTDENRRGCACTHAMAAVEAAVVVLEDSPWFNAGKGAVFTFDGGHELDASIMDGRTRRAGAVAGAKRCKNPVCGARKVLEGTNHVFLAGPEADVFFEEAGLEMVPTTYFDTDMRRHQWNQALTGNPIKVEENPKDFAKAGEKKFGTVGAVAVDKDGNVAAATSTGGMTNKRFGRVGDSPVIGAGTFADNRFCAVSATGHGEYFIRNAVAHDIVSRMRYLGETSEAAAIQVVQKGDLSADGGDGGVIVIDAHSRTPALVFNSIGMYRAWLGADGTVHTAIYDSE